MNEINKLFMQSSLLHSKWCEVWLPIKGFPNYEISSKGRVQNVTTNKMLKPFTEQNGYRIITLNRDGRKKKAKIHRLVAMSFLNNGESRPMVDHIDHNPSNNDVSNLRWVTRSQNAMNARKNSNNTSGASGVSWNVKRDRWIAYIMVNGVRKHLGNFINIDTAKRARKNAAEKLFGEYSNKHES